MELPLGVPVGPAAEFPVGTLRPVRAGGRTVLVVHTECGWQGLVNVCPHERLPLCLVPLGSAVPLPEPPAGAACQLTCPWHFWRFDLATGAAIVDPRFRIESVPVTLAQGMVYVHSRETD